MSEPRVHAFVLAAGMGTRLWPLTKYAPKMLLDLGDGTCLLDRHMAGISESGAVAGATIITGHLAANVETKVAETWSDFADTCFNPFFEICGPLASIWRVRDRLSSQDFIIANGDTLFTPQLVREVLSACLDQNPDSIVLSVSRVTEVMEDDVRVRLSNGSVTGVGKTLEFTGYRSAGLVAVRGQTSRRRVVTALDEIVRDSAALAPNSPWHELVNLLAARGGGVTGHIVDDSQWTEVDLHPDITELQRLIEKRVQPDAMSARHSASPGDSD